MAFFVALEPYAKQSKELLNAHDIVIRTANLKDCAAIAEIVADREGTDENYDRIYALWKNRVEGISQSDNQVFIAVLVNKQDKSQKIVGFSNVEYVDLKGKTDEETGEFFTAPSGWYLLGLTVHSDYRRLGIATLLTNVRIEWAKNHQAESIRYYTNPYNLTSMAFHAELGFQPMAKELTYPDRPTYKTVFFEKFLIPNS